MLSVVTSDRGRANDLDLITAALREEEMNAPLTEQEWDALLKQVDLEALDDPADYVTID
jgi:hypothetical protein